MCVCVGGGCSVYAHVTERKRESLRLCVRIHMWVYMCDPAVEVPSGCPCMVKVPFMHLYSMTSFLLSHCSYSPLILVLDTDSPKWACLPPWVYLYYITHHCASHWKRELQGGNVFILPVNYVCHLMIPTYQQTRRTRFEFSTWISISCIWWL